MADNSSLADRAVHALQLIKQIDAGVSVETPERHAIWDIKRQAEEQMIAACANAERLHRLAMTVREVCAKDEARHD